MHTSLYGIFAAINWAVADIFIAQSTKSIRPIIAAAAVNLLGALFFGIYYVLFIRQPIPPDLIGIAWSSLAGLCIISASIVFFIALNRGPIAIVSALSSTYPAVTLVLALSAFGAEINTIQSFGFFMVITGVVATAGLHSSGPVQNIGKASGTWPALLAAFFWGIGYGLLAEGVKVIGWEAASAMQFGVLAVCCLIILCILAQKDSANILSIKACARNPFILGAAVTQQLGAILLNIGIGDDTAGGSIIVALSACYPVLTTIMAFYIFKERVRMLALLAGALAIAGIVVLSI
jgi:drug/metabolite transporter (DMT)-like permease